MEKGDILPAYACPVKICEADPKDFTGMANPKIVQYR